MKKKIVNLVLLVLMAISITVSVMAYTTPSEREIVTGRTTLIQKGVFKNYALLKNNSIYGDKTELKYYPSNLIREIHGVYTYSINDNLSGNYTLFLNCVYFVKKGNDKIILWSEKLNEASGKFRGRVEESFIINLSKLNSRFGEIKSELKVNRLSRDLSIVFNAKTEKTSFKHDIGLANDYDLTYFTNVEKVDRKTYSNSSIVENKIIGGKLSVNASRIAFPLITFGILSVILPMNYRNLKTKISRKKRFPFVVDGYIEGNKVKLKRFEDLKKIFMLTDKPVIHTKTAKGDVFQVKADGIVYEFVSERADEQDEEVKETT